MRKRIVYSFAILVILLLSTMIEWNMTYGIETRDKIYYQTPGTDVEWTLDDLVINSNGNVTQEGDFYIFHNDVYIEQGDKLTIEPGSILKFKALTRLTIKGTLIADGTAENPINFTQDPEGDDWPTYWPDHWQGIFFDETSSSCIINNCLIENGANSLHFNVNSDVSFSNIHISTFFHGITGEFNDGDCIENITIDCGGPGLYLYRSNNIIVKNCRINAHSEYLIRLENSFIRFENNNISGNDGAIMMFYSSAVFSDTPINRNMISMKTNDSVVMIEDEMHIKVLNILEEPVNGSTVKITDDFENTLLNETFPISTNLKMFSFYSVIFRDLNNDEDCMDSSEMSSCYPFHVEVEKRGYEKYNRIIIPEENNILNIFLSPNLKFTTPIPDLFLEEDSDNGTSVIDLNDYFSADEDEVIEFDVCWMEDPSNLSASLRGAILDIIQLNENWNGKGSFQVRASGIIEIWVYSNIFNITVNPVNDDPEILEFDISEILEDIPFFLDMEAVDIDPTNDELEWELRTNAHFIDIDPSTGNLTGTPSNDDVGTWWINVSVSDGNGGSDRTNFTLTVLNVNDIPELNKTEMTLTMDEDSNGTSIEFKDVFFDIDGDVLSYSHEDSNNLTITVEEGTVMITPDPDWCGTEIIKFTASDGHRSVSLNVTIDVNPINDAPTDVKIIAGSNYVEGEKQIVDSSAIDVDIPFYDELTYSWSSDISGEIGVGQSIDLSLPAGNHLITLTVTDKEGLSATTTMEIEIEPAEDKNGPEVGLILIIILILVVVIVALIIGFMIIRRKRNESSVEEEESSDIGHVEETIAIEEQPDETMQQIQSHEEVNDSEMEPPITETSSPELNVNDDQIIEPMVEEQMENDIPIESDIYPTETEEQVFQDGPENPFLGESEELIS